MAASTTIPDTVSDVRLSSTRLRYDGASPGLELVVVESDLCHAVVATQGAQLMEFKPAGGQELLWLSPQAVYEPGNAIRGGIPVCFPWFGPHPKDPEKPQHGFVRNRRWSLDHIEVLSGGEHRLIYFFRSSTETEALYPFAFEAQLVMTLGETARLDFSVANRDERELPTSWALHSYHPVSDLADAFVSGLAGCGYVDKTESGASKVQEAAIGFAAEVDRVYLDAPDLLQLEGSPAIQVRSENAPTAIIWNAGPERARSIADLGANNHLGYVCVERGAALSNCWCIPPGEMWRATLEISSQVSADG